MTELVEAYPKYKQAADDASATFTYGDVIPLEWLYDAFGLEEGQTVEEYKNFQFKFMSNIISFIDEMLDTHKMKLKNIRGEGYRIVHPTEQTQVVAKDFNREVLKATKRAKSGLTNLRTDLLTTNRQRQEHTDAMARLSQFDAMRRNHRLIKRRKSTKKLSNDEVNP